MMDDMERTRVMKELTRLLQNSSGEVESEGELDLLQNSSGEVESEGELNERVEANF
jgi:hypothetical protein